MLWKQGSQRTIRLGGMGLTRTLIQAGALDRDGPKNRPDLGGMRALTALQGAAMGTGTLCLEMGKNKHAIPSSR